jgi:glutaryl-CoA dehydrogenase (non-decarboxylating)
MDFSLTEDQKMMQDTARRFAEEIIAPTIEEDEKNHRFNRDILAQMAEMGFFGCVIPEQYGGLGLDDGMVTSMIVTEEIARVSASWGLPFNMQTQGPARSILRWGTEEQKQAYIPKLVDCSWLSAFAITEPNSGSDVASMKTTAKEDGDSFILNGGKTWISNAQVADVALVYAKTEPALKHKGMTCFLVHLKETEGVTTVPIESKLGLHCAPTGEIYFENARVPKENILGGLNNGFKVCMTMLDNTRLSCACRAVGVGRGALEEAAKYAKEREQFGKPISDYQMIRADIAEMVVHHAGAQLLVRKAAWEKDQDANARNTASVSVAKYYASETANEAAHLTMKIFGSYGFSTEYPAERYLRDARSFLVVEGTSNIQKMIISGNYLAQ